MYNIGLVEIKCLNHELSALCKISNTKKNTITVFTTRPIFEVAKAETELKGEVDDYEWIFPKKDEGMFSFLRRIQKICNERIDLVIVNSLRIWQFLFFKPRCKMLCVVDDLNYWFRDIKSLKIYFKKIKDFKNNVLRNRKLIANAITGPIIRNSILSKYDRVMVEYPPFKAYIRSNFDYKGKIYCFPNRPFQGIISSQDDNKIRFVVPGMIQERRRDYELVLRVFENLFPKYKNLIELYFLGRPQEEYGRKIISDSQKLRKRGYRIFCSKEYVPPEIMDETLTKSDVIISPMRVKYRSGCVEEVYTITKPSGIFSDSIKYAKPCIVPETYNITEEMKTSFLTYKDEKDLQGILETLIDDKEKLENLKREAINNSKKFSLEKLQIKFDRMVEEIVFGEKTYQKDNQIKL